MCSCECLRTRARSAREMSICRCGCRAISSSSSSTSQCCRFVREKSKLRPNPASNGLHTGTENDCNLEYQKTTVYDWALMMIIMLAHSQCTFFNHYHLKSSFFFVLFDSSLHSFFFAYGHQTCSSNYLPSNNNNTQILNILKWLHWRLLRSFTCKNIMSPFQRPFHFDLTILYMLSEIYDL